MRIHIVLTNSGDCELDRLAVDLAVEGLTDGFNHSNLTPVIVREIEAANWNLEAGDTIAIREAE